MRSKADLFAAIRRDRRAVLVVNTRSRPGARPLRGRPWPTQHGRVRPAHRRRGDGTISEAARHRAHRDIALGVLPLGTTNNVARTLGIPLNLSAAITVLTDGKVADVDLGLVGDYRSPGAFDPSRCLRLRRSRLNPR
jgi:hypothetical protein